MDRAIEAGVGEGGAHTSLASRVVQSTRNHLMLWIRVLYALTINRGPCSRGKAAMRLCED